MEASTKMVGAIEPMPQPDADLLAFVMDAESNLPAGDDLTAAECRVDYLLEKAADERRRLDQLEEFTRRRVEMILAHKTTEATKIEKRLAWLEGRIREHVPFDADGFRKQYGAKSTRLPHGQVGYRKHPATVEIVDPAKALMFAQARGLQITVKQSIGKTPLNEWVIRSGEDPDPERDGFRFVPAADEFFAHPDADF